MLPASSIGRRSRALDAGAAVLGRDDADDLALVVVDGPPELPRVDGSRRFWNMLMLEPSCSVISLSAR
jgi:hypothetical protein